MAVVDNKTDVYVLHLFHLDFPSFILFGMPSYIRQLKKWLPPYNGLMLCYRASEDRWNSRRFHAGCDGKGPTVTIIRVLSYIFGGYTDISWGGKSILIIISFFI